MAADLTEYRDRAKSISGDPAATPVAPGSCLAFVMAEGFLGIADGYFFFRDFGDMLAFYAYSYLQKDLRPNDPEDISVSWVIEYETGQPTKDQGHGQYWTQAERQQRYAEGVAGLVDLLERFIRDGYDESVREQARELLNRTLVDQKINSLFVLPDDLNDLLDRHGNPLADYDAFPTEEEAEANAPTFDLNNPEHRAALQERLETIGQ